MDASHDDLYAEDRRRHAATAASASADAVPTSLDTPESNAQISTPVGWVCPPVPCNADQEFRHSHWHPQRQATYEALHAIGAGHNRREAFESCGSAAWVYESTFGPKDFCIRASHCHDRFCMPCATARSWAVMAEISRRAAGRELRFVTLTLRGRPGEGLRAMLDRLYSGFRQLRRLVMWEESVKGGVAVCEVKHAEKGHWHPHLHILCEGAFIDQRALSVAWKACTGDSYIVDVRAVRDVEQGVRYVAKYASKPMESGFWRDPSLLAESMLALRGRRLILSFGSWHNPSDELDDIEEVPFASDPRCWVQIGTLADVYKRSICGDANATAILRVLRVRDPLTGERPPPRTG